MQPPPLRQPEPLFRRLLRQPTGETRSNRIHRGFWRLGATLACLAAGIGLIATSIGTSSTYTEKKQRLETLACLKRQPITALRSENYAPYNLKVKESGCSGWAYVTAIELDQLDLAHSQEYVWEALAVLAGGTLATLLASTLIYGFTYALGWILAGFFS